MKSNWIKYVFIIFVIAVIIAVIYKVNQKENEKETIMPKVDIDSYKKTLKQTSAEDRVNAMNNIKEIMSQIKNIEEKEEYGKKIE